MGSEQLSMFDYKRSLKEEGFLLDVSMSPLKKTNGVIIVNCGDCDRSPELYKYQANLCRQAGREKGDERVHTITLNGGALLLHKHSPLNANHDSSRTLLYHIKNTAPLKGINDVALYMHYNCGAGEMARLTPEQYFEWLAKGADHLGSMIPSLNIACKFHYHVDNERTFKTYYFDHKSWLESKFGYAKNANA